MQTKHFIFNDCSQREQVEQISEVLPHVSISVLPQALVIEAIDLGDLSRFMIASENGHSFPESNLIAHQQGHSLY